MDFSFNINSFLPEEITKVDSRLQTCRQHGIDRFGFQELQRMLYEVVDKLGDASAKAQKLPGTITTGKRLESSNHHLYIMKDTSGEKSCVIGILKVGTKKLFVYDSCKRQHELEPLCVLDFYVHESLQRMGCGKKLFDFMLRSENIPVQQMAIDRPSPKFLSFLKKHFKLYATIPQVNNYVIFEGFFNQRNDQRNGQRRMNGSGYHSNTSNRMPPNSGRKSRTPTTPQQPQQPNNAGNYSSFPSSSKYENRQSSNYMAAGDRMYSRHGATPPNTRATPPNLPSNPVATPQVPLSANGSNAPSPFASRSNSSSNRYNDTLNTQPSQNQNYYDMNFNKMGSPYMQYAMGASMARYKKNNMSAPSTGALQHEQCDRFQPSSAQNTNNNYREPQRMSSNNGAYINGSANTPISLPEIKNGSSARQSDNNSHQNNSVFQRPPSGKTTKPSEPPMLQRDGPPSEYKTMLNMHQTYQGRDGRFIVPSSPNQVRGAPSYTTPQTKPPTYEQSYGNDWKWSVSGYVREERMKQNVSSKYNPGRLW